MYLPLRWRNWQDFGTGILGDHGPHFWIPLCGRWSLIFRRRSKATRSEAYSKKGCEGNVCQGLACEPTGFRKGTRPAVSLQVVGI